MLHEATPQDPERAWLGSLGLRPLSPTWAKVEIILGLVVAAVGVKLLGSASPTCWGGGALFSLGLYLALAGHRSHLYQAMNRQNARLAKLIADSATLKRD